MESKETSAAEWRERWSLNRERVRAFFTAAESAAEFRKLRSKSTREGSREAINSLQKDLNFEGKTFSFFIFNLF